MNIIKSIKLPKPVNLHQFVRFKSEETHISLEGKNIFDDSSIHLIESYTSNGFSTSSGLRTNGNLLILNGIPFEWRIKLADLTKKNLSILSLFKNKPGKKILPLPSFILEYFQSFGINVETVDTVKIDILLFREMKLLQSAIEKLHEEAIKYIDPETGYDVSTKLHHLNRGYCCGCKCRHCPYGHVNVGFPEKVLEDKKKKNK